jgi:hypothetical protein
MIRINGYPLQPAAVVKAYTVQDILILNACLIFQIIIPALAVISPVAAPVRRFSDIV